VLPPWCLDPRRARGLTSWEASAMGIGTMARWSCRAPSWVIGSEEGARFELFLGHGDGSMAECRVRSFSVRRSR
jgi:hypothetical protein